MLVSKATNQDLCPAMFDRRWMEEHETVATLTKRLHLLIVCDVTHKPLWYVETVRKSDTKMKSFYSGCATLNYILPWNTSTRQMDEAD